MGFHHHTDSYSLQYLLIYSCFLRLTSAIDSISVNQSVVDPDYLISSAGNFKLGFFSPPNNSYRYVGVMYNLPVMTVIWVANRDKPINDSTGSSLQISEDGNLVILDGRKRVIWSTNITNSAANTSALLLDTGNLVLRANSSDTYAWESFRHASDSLVETMRVFTDLNRNERNKLTSWRSASDPSPGIYTATLEVLEIPEVFVWKDGNIPYWRSGPWNNQIFTGIPDMVSFYKKEFEVVITSPGSAYYYFTMFSNSTPVYYYVLEPTGELLEKQWSDVKGDWDVTWLSTYSACDMYGKCGPFGHCNDKDKAICRCFQGFVPTRKDEWRAGNWSSGCRRRKSLQCDDSDGFVKVSGVKPPDHFRFLLAYEEDCRFVCLRNCSCVGYAFSAGIGCMQWTENLIDVQKLADGGGIDLYIRLAHSELGGNNKRMKVIIATTVVLGFITIVVSTFFLRRYLLSYRARRKQQNVAIHQTNERTDIGHSEETTLQHTVYGVKLDDFIIYKFQMLSNATQDFSLINKLGQGGFGPVYKGKLGNGRDIAVKRLAISSSQGSEEFMNEVEVISRLQHRNLVKLLGCCVDCEEKMLVYEYMPNGSLDSYLFDSRKREVIDWKMRMIIIEGICRGLLYLHRDSRLRIIHRDLKASNILLDEELNPKISDFGMARIFGSKDDEANTTRVVGTYGYMSPEYALHGIFSEKSDVYSFGVLLLETMSGRRNSRFCDEDQQLFLIAYAWKLWNDGRIIELMDPAIYDPRMESEIVRYANIGLLCVQELAAERPNVTTILLMLSCEIVQLPFPKQPAFVGIPRYLETEYSPKNSSTKYSVNTITVSVVEGR